MLKAIDRRMHNDYAINAGFHGIKIPIRHNIESAPSQVESMSEADRAYLDKVIAQGQSRVRSRYV